MSYFIWMLPIQCCRWLRWLWRKPVLILEGQPKPPAFCLSRGWGLHQAKEGTWSGKSASPTDSSESRVDTCRESQLPRKVWKHQLLRNNPELSLLHKNPLTGDPKQCLRQNEWKGVEEPVLLIWKSPKSAGDPTSDLDKNISISIIGSHT